MTEDVRGDAPTFVPGTGASDRKAEARRRLATALRANLRRRKASRPLDDPTGGPVSPGEGVRPVDDDQMVTGDAAGGDATDGDRG